jgi:hypothetical protein
MADGSWTLPAQDAAGEAEYESKNGTFGLHCPHARGAKHVPRDYEQVIASPMRPECVSLMPAP